MNPLHKAFISLYSKWWPGTNALRVFMFVMLFLAVVDAV
jgi:hypothetical protein